MDKPCEKMIFDEKSVDIFGLGVAMFHAIFLNYPYPEEDYKRINSEKEKIITKGKWK